MKEFYDCPRCKKNAEPKTIIMESGPHYAKEVCSVCGRYIKWLKKPAQRYVEELPVEEEF